HGEPRLLVRRVLDRARRESPLERIAPLRSLSGLAAELEDAGAGPGARVGFELDVLPAQAYLGYAKRLPGIELADCTAAVRGVRAVKSAWDLEQMAAACEQVRLACEAVPGLIGAGVSEAEVQLEVERELRRAGHQGQLLGGPSGAVPGYSDSPLCGPGPNPAVGKGAGTHVLRPGDTVIADLVGGHEGWLSDQTRTFAVGEPPADMAAAYDVAVAILRAVEQRLAPGTPPSSLYELSARVAADAGLEEHFMGAGAE